jgi:hypothetical protein
MEETSSTYDWSFWFAISMGLVFAVGLPIFLVLRQRGRLLTWLQFFVPDGSGRFLHIFGAERVMPEDGESFDIWHHRLFDLNTLTFHAGEKQRGDDLELDSPFVKRSMDALGKQVGFRLTLGQPAEDVDDQEEPDENDQYALRQSHPPLLLREGSTTDTVKQRPLPADCIVVTMLNTEPEKFTIAVRQNGVEKGSHLIPGDADYFGKVIWVDSKHWVAMTYRRLILSRSGMALLILDYESGKLVFNNFITASSKKPAAAAQQ